MYSVVHKSLDSFKLILFNNCRFYQKILVIVVKESGVMVLHSEYHSDWSLVAFTTASGCYSTFW